jgi:protein tyrosine/serine phosphatase
LTDRTTLDVLRTGVDKLVHILSQNSETCIVHCSAGIHRTGLTGYTILRCAAGMDQKEAYEGLRHMREHTYNGVEQWRIDYAEKFLVDFILHGVKFEDNHEEMDKIASRIAEKDMKKKEKHRQTDQTIKADN